MSGETCRVSGTECCLLISDATADALGMNYHTAQGIIFLFKN